LGIPWQNEAVEMEKPLRRRALLAALLGASQPDLSPDNAVGIVAELPPSNAQVFTTTCQYCKVQCGYKIYVWERGTGRQAHATRGESINPTFVAPAYKDGKPVYVASIPDSECVINEGNYSVRGGSMGLDIYSPDRRLRYPKQSLVGDRLKTPMIRRGGKNSSLEAVGWNAAIAFAADRLSKIKDQHGPDALGLVSGDWLYTLPTYAILKLWFSGIGSSSFAGNGYFYNHESAGLTAVYGDGTRSFTVQDFDETDLLVTAGHNLEATGSVWYYRFLANNMAPGTAKHLVIDPHHNYMAQLAELHGGLFLQIRPGTDAILAGAIIRRILEERQYDQEFVAKHTTGIDEVHAVVMQPRFTIENASRETSIPEEKIHRAVELLIEHRGKTMILFEKGIMHQLAGFSHMTGYTVLGTILGNIGRSGATTSRAGGHPRGLFAAPKEPPSSKGETLYTRLKAGTIKALWAFGSNVFRQLPDQAHYAPLIRETFFIVQDRIHTEMDAAADVIFPAASWGETDGILASEDRRIRITHAFVDPPGSAKPDWWIAAQVAQKMRYSGFEWQSAKQIWEELRVLNEDVKDIKWEMLEASGTNGVQYPYLNAKSIERLYSDEYEAVTGKRFPTSDGKAHLESIRTIAEFDPKKHEWGDIETAYPFMAFDFRLNELWNSGYTYWNNPSASNRTRDAFAVIHPEDAQARGIRNGDWIKVSSAYGEIAVVADVSRNVPKGSIGIPAMFPKALQANSNIFSPRVAAELGDIDTMVAVQVSKV
jgi:arsenite oxidase large subunit